MNTATLSQTATTSPLPGILGLDEVLLQANAQNLVNRWNNIIIETQTGTEQLAAMRASGIFADDIELVFDFGAEKRTYHDLTSPEDFYNSFINPLKKPRYNLASNVEVLAFGEGSLRFRFKHWIFFGDKLSLVGDNECTMVKDSERYYLTRAYIRVIHFDTEHAY